MDPTIVVILISAIVLVFPVIKNAWTRLNGPETPAVIFTPPAQGDTAAPAAQTAAGDCLSKLVELAACLPEAERKDLVQRFAADLVMKELE